MLGANWEWPYTVIGKERQRSTRWLAKTKRYSTSNEIHFIYNDIIYKQLIILMKRIIVANHFSLLRTQAPMMTFFNSL